MERERSAATISAPPETLATLGRRIVVLGVTGSGKSTLAAELARRIGASHIELDAFQWSRTGQPLRSRFSASA